jgi:hypothetical protein
LSLDSWLLFLSLFELLYFLFQISIKPWTKWYF